MGPSKTVRNCCKAFAHTENVKAGKTPLPDIITAGRQPPNLLRQLSLNIRRDHNSPNENQAKNIAPCKDKRCLFCPLAIKEDSYKTKNGTLLKRNSKMSCKSMDLIYLLVCQGCGKEYIGETGTKTNERTNLHRNQIENSNYRELKVSKHVHS